MTTLTANPTSPRRSHTPLTSDTSSFILKELNEQKVGIRCCDDEGNHPSKILHKIPTSKFSASNANAVVDLLDDDDHHLLIANMQEDSTSAPTLLQEWEAFYIDFKNSITYTLATSDAANNLPSLIDDDDADEDRRIYECELDEIPTNSNAGLRRLRHTVRELEKVNLQLASFVELLYTQAPCQPTLCSTENNPPHPQPCWERPSTVREIQLIVDPAPQTAPCDFPLPLPTEQPIPAWVTPAVPMNGLELEPQRDDIPQAVPKPAPPPAPNLSADSNQTQQSPSGAYRHSTIPNWAKPAVPTPALDRLLYTGKPPPRPDRKTIPFRKKTQTKPHAANQKDFLRPP